MMDTKKTRKPGKVKLFEVIDHNMDWAAGGWKKHIADDRGILLCKRNPKNGYPGRLLIDRQWIEEHAGQPESCKLCFRKARLLLGIDKSDQKDNKP